MISFTTIPYTLNEHAILRLPSDVSTQLTSRSQIMVTGKIAGAKFAQPLEPDGMGGHWIDASPQLVASAQINDDKPVDVDITPTNDWLEPTMPREFDEMLRSDPAAKMTYSQATPMAHWEWLRWVTSTKNPETYTKRIAVSRNKLARGMRRPCCFNRASCAVVAVVRSGVLIDPRD